MWGGSSFVYAVLSIFISFVFNESPLSLQDMVCMQVEYTVPLVIVSVT